MEKPTHDDDVQLGKLAKTTGVKEWFEGWRHYKTKRGAQAYAKKHKGMWVIIDCSPKIMTKRELEWLGTWIVGRADHYLFYRKQMPDKFDEYYPAVEWWDDGVLR